MASDDEFRRALAQLVASLPADLSPWAYPPPALSQRIEAFATAWCFPAGEGVLHLWVCLHTARGRPEPWRWLTPEIDLGDGVEVGVVTVDESGQRAFHLREGLDPETMEPLIVPPALPAITYDPSTDDPSWIRARARRLAKDVEKAIVAQAERIEQDARASGRRAVPPRYGASDLRRMALRLYRRTRSMRPGDIADSEGRETTEECDPEEVRRTVREWAKALRVELPALPTGRPRRKKPST
jgi:hypothetical protein